MAAISVLDLTAGQVEEIERSVGLPVTRWADADSVADLYCRILSAVNHEPVETYKALTMKQLLGMVDLDGDESDEGND